MQDTVLVTGGSGFIGSWVLRELLRGGRRVVALDVRPAQERWRRVLESGAKDVVFSDASLTDRDAFTRVSIASCWANFRLLLGRV